MNDVLVSDFVTPAYYGPATTKRVGSAVQYSFRESVDGPHRLSAGGAMSWHDGARNLLVHATCAEDGRIEQTELESDPADARPARARVHGMVKNRRSTLRMNGMAHSLKATNRRLASGAAMRARAQMFRAELDKLELGGPAKLNEPSNAEIGQRLDAAIARAGLPAVDADTGELLAFLRAAKAQLEAENGKPGEELFELSLVRSALRNPIGPGILTARDVPGLAQYDHEDIRWAKALIEFAIHRKAEFPICPLAAEGSLVHPISDAAVIAIAGDWGTHNASSRNIANAIASQRPTHTLHLGDVYYAGTEDEEQRFIRDWPAGTAGTFTLNSNHEMYCGGSAYFGKALQSDKFDYQTYSYFALSSSEWLFIGLDSAYHATAAGLTPYDVGHIPAGDPQVGWLRRLLSSNQALSPTGKAKKLCLFTHHQALDIHGNQTALFDEMLAALGRAPDLWYWGHIHGAAVYAPRQNGAVAFAGRLLGHGGIPYISDFPQAQDAANRVVWAERSNGNAVGANGFAVLKLSGAELQERFYDEHGTQHWP